MKTAKELIKEIVGNKELFEEVSKIRTEQETIEFLQKHDCDTSFEKFKEALSEYQPKNNSNIVNLEEQVSGGIRKPSGSGPYYAPYPFDDKFHLVVMWSDRCPLYLDSVVGGVGAFALRKGNCSNCKNSYSPDSSANLFCKVRTKDNDPVRDGKV